MECEAILWYLIVGLDCIDTRSLLSFLLCESLPIAFQSDEPVEGSSSNQGLEVFFCSCSAPLYAISTDDED